MTLNKLINKKDFMVLLINSLNSNTEEIKGYILNLEYSCASIYPDGYRTIFDAMEYFKPKVVIYNFPSSEAKHVDKCISEVSYEGKRNGKIALHFNINIIPESIDWHFIEDSLRRYHAISIFNVLLSEAGQTAVSTDYLHGAGKRKRLFEAASWIIKENDLAWFGHNGALRESMQSTLSEIEKLMLTSRPQDHELVDLIINSVAAPYKILFNKNIELDMQWLC